MKYEIKIEFENKKELKNIIESCYFGKNGCGKLHNKEEFLTIEKEDPYFILFKGLSNATIRITNQNLIDGIMRFVITETQDLIQLHPCSIYCIIEDGKYSFY